MNTLYQILKIAKTVLLTASATEDYNLNIVLTDKNNIVIHEESKSFRYNSLQVGSLIKEIEKIGDVTNGNN